MTVRACARIAQEIAVVSLIECTRANSCVERLMQLTKRSRRLRFCSLPCCNNQSQGRRQVGGAEAPLIF